MGVQAAGGFAAGEPAMGVDLLEGDVLARVGRTTIYHVRIKSTF